MQLQICCSYLATFFPRLVNVIFRNVAIPVVISSLIKKAMFKDQMAVFSTLSLFKKNQPKQKNTQSNPNPTPNPHHPKTNTLEETRTSH